MTAIEFGRRLLDSRDLDPVYVLLWEAKMGSNLLYRWLLAYWCFYHVGTASWIVDAGPMREGYWERMKEAAASKEYPRSPERRHFRGKNATDSVAWLRSQGVYALFAPLLSPKEQPLERIQKTVQTWKGFGPWISFKVADMLERLEITKVGFDTGSVFLFDSPREGAEALYREERSPSARKFERVSDWAVFYLWTHLQDHRAPPRYERTINVQEIETVLCKWNSHRKGGYHVGEDIEAARKGLERFPDSPTAQRLMGAGKVAKLW